MPINPAIALGVKGIELADPLAQYGRVAAIQQAQQQNALANMQMQEYERARQEEQGIRNRLAGGASLEDPETRNFLLGTKTGRDILQRQSELMKAQTEDAARRAKLMQDTEAMYRNMAGQISNKAEAATFLQNMLNDPALKNAPITRIPLMEQVRRIPEDPQGLDNWVKQFALGTTKWITENKPVTTAQDTGAGGRLISRPGLGGAATVVPGSEFTKTPTIGERTAQGQLALAQQKFAWEQANPGYELKEGEDGTIYGVNKRTLQATPVSVGAPTAAPSVAPTAAPSVAPTAAPGAVPTTTPLKGKGQALNESQSNATAFGMRMVDANKLLTDFEKAGVTSGGRIKGAVEGTLTSLVPFQGERLAEGAGAVMNVLPGFMGGPNESQQAYSQAKTNFITAVLRKESGAAISPSEFATEEKKYFPQAGESAKVIQQKQRARQLAIDAMKIQAGPGAKNIGVTSDGWSVER